MESSELAFYTNQELVEELMRRKTFLGVVVQSEAEWKGRDWGEERVFKVHLNGNLDATQAGRLLDRVAEHLNLYHC